MEKAISTICGVNCYEENGVAYLELEAVAWGLGFTQVQIKNGKEYTSVRWETVRRYLSDIGFPNNLGKGDFIPENTFYRLAMKAKNETAEKFQAIVADEIIPSIRKTGGYIATTPEMTDAEIMAKALLVAHNTIQEREKRIGELTEENRAMQPKALFADSVAASENTILIYDLAKLLRQNGVDIGGTRLFRWMRDNGYLVRRKGTDYNMPTQKSMDMGLFRVKETTHAHSDGHISITRTPKVTGKGQVYFVNKFLNKD